MDFIKYSIKKEGDLEIEIPREIINEIFQTDDPKLVLDTIETDNQKVVRISLIE